MNKKLLMEKYYHTLNESLEDIWNEIKKFLGLDKNPTTGIPTTGGGGGGGGSFGAGPSTTTDNRRNVDIKRVEALATGDKASNIRSLASPEFQNMSINQRTSTITRERALARNLAKAELEKAKSSGDRAAIEKYTKAYKDLETGPMNLQPVEVRGGDSRAKYYGRLLQRGAKMTPTTLDQANYRAAAERDIEREGPLDRYKDRGEVYKGMEERGFDLGSGDFRALSQEAKAAKDQFNKDFAALVAKYGDEDPPQDEIDALLAKRNKAVDRISQWPNVR